MREPLQLVWASLTDSNPCITLSRCWTLPSKPEMQWKRTPMRLCSLGCKLLLYWGSAHQGKVTLICSPRERCVCTYICMYIWWLCTGFTSHPTHTSSSAQWANSFTQLPLFLFLPSSPTLSLPPPPSLLSFPSFLLPETESHYICSSTWPDQASFESPTFCS